MGERMRNWISQCVTRVYERVYWAFCGEENDKICSDGNTGEIGRQFNIIHKKLNICVSEKLQWLD